VITPGELDRSHRDMAAISSATVMGWGVIEVQTPCGELGNADALHVKPKASTGR
jgi:hypothetical protein